MKKIFTIFSLLLTVTLNAQNPVTNPGFEDWAGNEPLDWMTINNDPYFTITPSAQSHSGDSAARGEVISLGPVGQLAPLLISGGVQGIPVTQWYTTLTFWYMIDMLTNDVLSVEVIFFDSTATGIGGGAQTFFGSQPNYTMGTVSIPPGTGIPKTCIVTFSIMNPGGSSNLGSWFIVDDVDLNNGTSGINMPEKNQGLSVFPNPVHDHLYVKCSSGKELMKEVEIKMYDMTGRLVFQNKLNETGSARFDISSITPGTYVLEAVSSSFHQRCKVLKN